MLLDFISKQTLANIALCQQNSEKEIHIPAAFNNINISSTGLYRQPREAGKVSFFMSSYIRSYIAKKWGCGSEKRVGPWQWSWQAGSGDKGEKMVKREGPFWGSLFTLVEPREPPGARRCRNQFLTSRGRRTVFLKTLTFGLCGKQSAKNLQDWYVCGLCCKGNHWSPFCWLFNNSLSYFGRTWKHKRDKNNHNKEKPQQLGLDSLCSVSRVTVPVENLLAHHTDGLRSPIIGGNVVINPKAKVYPLSFTTNHHVTLTSAWLHIPSAIMAKIQCYYSITVSQLWLFLVFIINIHSKGNVISSSACLFHCSDAICFTLGVTYIASNMQDMSFCFDLNVSTFTSQHFNEFVSIYWWWMCNCSNVVQFMVSLDRKGNNEFCVFGVVHLMFVWSA